VNRIFISYRASDGKKDADRLCADLSRLYGADQVFFDKQDLRGGLSWRTAIMDTLGTQPVVLLLITPDLLGMSHPEGGRRIDHEDDPIRGELLTAQSHGALIVPLLTEGMAMPPAAELPAALRFLRESHALKLRTEDWSTDLDRLIADLREHGIAPRKSLEPDPGPPRRTLAQRVQRGLTWVGGVFVALVVLGLLLPEDEETADPPSALAQVADISGIWWSIDESNRPLRVHLAVDGGNVQLQTDAFPVDWYPEWQAYAQSVLSQGLVVKDVRYLGKGMLTHVMGAPRIEAPYEAYTGDGRGPLTTGSVVLKANATGKELTGELWSNGEQASTPLRLVRRP
jgi:hypothetical protein